MYIQKLIINIDNNIWQDILVWHEILIYGAYDTELFDKLNQHVSYKTFDNEFIHNYSYFIVLRTHMGVYTYYPIYLSINIYNGYLIKFKYIILILIQKKNLK